MLLEAMESEYFLEELEWIGQRWKPVAVFVDYSWEVERNEWTLHGFGYPI